MNASLPIETRNEPAAPPERLVAWVDGAGAFLLCFGESVSVGGLAGRADVRVAADLAADHAKISRSGEGYFVEAAGPALVASEPAVHAGRRGSGRVVEGRTDLNNSDELLLYREGGSGVRLRFCRPNVLTATATLTFASDHRTEPRFDTVVLFAEACVLGPGVDAHLRCRHWEESVLLYLRDGELWAKSVAPLALTGRESRGPIAVRSGDYVTAPGISFRLEAL
ncbi:MAG: hypothetical protein H0T47_22235 [Planctomycetaceae bacterium]|nr:hypothetical protein [Planctomycetaceae bacterium]